MVLGAPYMVLHNRGALHVECTNLFDSRHQEFFSKRSVTQTDAQLPLDLLCLID